ncbi:MAG: CDP-archaeol synthase [Candidatus Rokubacteria bacterium]|nr:CDP-archaeol synthase [Candidatus Rokubacteria bacterium]
MAPAYVANMSAPLIRYWRGWNRPISSRWLGTHKTVMGFAAGLLGALIMTFLQHLIGWRTGVVDHDRWVELGLRFGVGAMAGDSAKSFFKQRLRIPPGRPWIPFDQLDFVLGALIVVAPRAALGLGDIALVLGVSAAGHIAVNHAAYWLGIRDVKW